MAVKKTVGKKSEKKPAQTPQRSKYSIKLDTSIKEEEIGQGQRFPIVALGASAGGLHSLQRFFSEVPERTGMGFIVITHLDPDHTSLMPEMIRKVTKMEVVHIEDGMKVEPNTVYVIPPSKELGIMQGVLQLEDIVKGGPRAPINRFFRLFAEDQQEHAIAIVLSGLGSDGSMGIKVIKEKLGMVMSEEPDFAKYDGMPRSAIETGMVDFVLPPAKMFAKVKEYAARHYKLGTSLVKERDDADVVRSLPKIYMLLRSGTGHDFSNYKRNTILRRIDRRMYLQQIDQLGDYVNLLKNNPDEIRTLYKDLLIGVTSFFRDPEAFESLKEKALRPLLQALSHDSALRIWVPGCSTGEEAYSLAIALWEVMEDTRRFLNVQLFATDIDEEAVQVARAGTYPESICADIGPERLNKYFDKDNSRYSIRRSIRDLMVFAAQSVIKDPPFTRLDLICCRNLLIYLDTDLQRKLLPLFHYSLKSDGYLFLGTSETVGQYTDLFKIVDNKWKIFQTKSAAQREFLHFPLTTSQLKTGLPAKKKEPELEKIIIGRLLQDHTPACVVADQQGEIAYIHGRTGRYLEPASGKAHMNVFDMAREGLKFPLQVLLRDSAKKSSSVQRLVRVKQNGSHYLVNLEVTPVSNEEAPPLFMIVFHPAPEEDRMATDDPEVPERGRLKELEEDLRTTKENLQSTIEELETANEELKSANEEHQSTNEELQSANEELNSSKEELQSLNEELVTVNAEMQGKNEELERKNKESAALLNEMDVPMLLLDGELRIIRFSNTIERIVNLLDSDVGRSIDDMASKLKYPSLVLEVRQVLATLAAKEIEAQTQDGRRFLIRIRAHELADSGMGIIVSFVDISRLRAIEELLENTRKRLRLSDEMMNALEDAFIVIDRDMKVLKTNQSFCTMFNIAKETIEGQNLFESKALGWVDMRRLRTLLERSMDEKEESAEVVVDYDEHHDGGRKLRFRAQAIVLDGGLTKMLLNVSERE